MNYEVKLPELGENDDSGLVVGILVDVGDQIEVDDSLIEVEISKATVEIPAEATGIVQEIMIQENDEIQTGTTIMIIETELVTKSETPSVKQQPLSAKHESEPATSTSSPVTEVIDDQVWLALSCSRYVL